MKAYTFKIENNVMESVNTFLGKLLSEKVVDALLVPQETPTGKSVLQTFVKKADEVKRANPFVPLLLTNSARLVSRLTMDAPEEKIGVVMRSCEIRAAVELIKLKQISPDNLIVIGVDCMGTYESKDYQTFTEKDKDAKTITEVHLSGSVKGEPVLADGGQLRLACRSCEYPSPENTDIAINFLGHDTKNEILVQVSEKIDNIQVEQFGLTQAEDITKWENTLKNCKDKRIKFCNELFEEVKNITKDVQEYMKELEHCRRCYNCRKECPICYCRECIFESKTFEHNSKQYLGWANKRGKIRMPSDTLLFHLTRMNHMVVSCVACGQCTSACPNGVPIGKFFKTIGAKVQEVFDYKSGRNVEEEIPQSTFKEDEFSEIGEH